MEWRWGRCQGLGQFWLLDPSPAGQASCHQVSEQPCRTLLQAGSASRDWAVPGTVPSLVHSPVFGAVPALSVARAVLPSPVPGAVPGGVCGLGAFAELGESLWGWRGQRGFAGMGVGKDERGLLGYLASRGQQRGLLGFTFSLPSSSWGFTVFYENEKHEKQQW